MKPMLKVSILLIVLAVFASGCGSKSPTNEGEKEDTATYIVVFDGEIDENVITSAGATIKNEIKSIQAIVTELTKKQFNKINQNEKVKYIEEDQEVEASDEK